MSATLIKIFLIVGLAVALINDVGVVAIGYYEVEGKARRIANAALLDYRVNQNDNAAVIVARETAERESVELTGFQITSDLVRVSITIPPRRTWIANRISYLRSYISPRALVEVPIND